MAWPAWMIRGTIKKVLKPVRAELEGEPLAPQSALGEKPTLALLSSCGLHLRSDTPFETGVKGDPTFRQFSADVNPDELMITHGHYDEDAVSADWQLAFPVDLVHEWVAQGRVSALHPTLHSFRGFFLDSREFVDRQLPAVIDELLQGGVDAALLTPC